MKTIISPVEFLLTNVICFAAGAVTAVAMKLVVKAAYGAGKRQTAAGETAA